MSVYFVAPESLSASRDFLRIVLPYLNLFLLMDKEIKTQDSFNIYLPYWSAQEQVRTLAYLICSNQTDIEHTSFLLSFIKDKDGHHAYIPEQKITVDKAWEYFLALAQGILDLDLSFFVPSQVGFLCYAGLEQAVQNLNQGSKLDIPSLLAELLGATFNQSSATVQNDPSQIPFYG